MLQHRKPCIANSATSLLALSEERLNADVTALDNWQMLITLLFYGLVVTSLREWK